MNCPICAVELMMSERSGVEIDYCPKCRGVWLDRGELDKIVARSWTEEAAGLGDRYEARRDKAGGHRDDRAGKPRSKSLLGDLFDFG
jgi:Zn-finger nucleic acid-binding protein